MTEKNEKYDFAVEFYFRMRNLAHLKKGRDQKRRDENSSRANSQPFTKGRDPVSASTGLDSLLKTFAWETPLAEADLFNNWAEIVGEQNAQNSTPENLIRGLLTVRCKSTAWATQLRLMQEQILQRLNEKYPALEISSIKFLGPDAPSWKHGSRSVPGRGPRDTYG